jgi:hypothetical protein
MLCYFTASNDRNGNPRRGFAWLANGAPVCFWPEGYLGHHAVPSAFRSVAAGLLGHGIPVSAAVYARLCRLDSPDSLTADAIESGRFRWAGGR